MLISLPRWKLLINETVIIFNREFVANKKGRIMSCVLLFLISDNCTKEDD